MADLSVQLGERSYPVQVVQAELAELGAMVGAVSAAQRVVLVSETRVAPLWAERATASLRAAGLHVERVILPAGEENKTLETWSGLVGKLLELGVDRRTPLIALGGGVLGDIVGFAAASTLRGVPFVQVPTTLLAMVDSSVGGKTAVNHPVGKNLIGAFHQPIAVHADVGTLSTLPKEELRAGLAEAVKTAVIDGEEFLSWMESEVAALSAGEPAAMIEVVRRCVGAKAAVVAADERESGLREVLNLGHTVGHGLEAVLGYGSIRHGEAVSIGMVAEAQFALREGICDAALVERLRGLLAQLGLPVQFPGVDRGAVARAMRLDKKARATFVSVPLAERVGRVRRVSLDLERLHELIE